MNGRFYIVLSKNWVSLRTRANFKVIDSSLWLDLICGKGTLQFSLIYRFKPVFILLQSFFFLLISVSVLTSLLKLRLRMAAIVFYKA